MKGSDGMSYLLSPKVDFVFKKIFGNEKHPEILISFLNAVIKPQSLIKSVQIRNTDIDKEYLSDKYSKLDIKALTDKGEYVNIEIQVKNEYNMIKRSLYYWSKLFESQIVEGDDYDKLERTICINILDFKYLKNDNFHNTYRLKEINTNEELTDTMEIHFIEIPKLKHFDDTDEVVDMLEAWVSFIKNPDSKIVDKLEMSRSEIREAKAQLIKISGDSKERERYEMRMESMLEKTSSLNSAERKGREEGLKEGAKKEKLEIANNLILNGLDDELISKSTGLSLEEIKNLRNN